MKKPDSPLSEAEILRRKAEEQLKMRKKTAGKPSSDEAEIRKLTHELQVHQIELEMQCEELTRAKEAAEITAQKYTELYDFAPMGYFTLDKQGVILKLNLYGASMLGKERRHLMNKRFGTYLSEHSKPGFNNLLDKTYSGKDNAFCEVTVENEGKKVPVYFYLSCRVNESREEILLTAIDITERKQAEDNLFLSEQKNRAWLENSPACTKIVDLDFNLQYMSKSGIEGLQIEDFTPYYGKPYPFYFYPESFKTTMTDNMILAKSTGKVITQEAPVVDVNGHEVWFHSTIIPVKDLKGEIDYLLIVSIDTTERKIYESDLIASEENLSVITSNTPDHIVVHDNKLRYTFVVNPQLGLTKEQYIGRSDFEIGLSEQDAIHLTSIKRKVLETGNPVKVEIPLKNLSGNTEYFEGSLIPRFDNNGKVNGLIGYFRNVTEHKNAEEKQKESDEKYRLLAEQSDVGVGLYSAEGIVLYFNNRALKNLGGNLEDYVGKSQIDLFGKKAGTKYLNRIKEVIRLQKTLVFEDFLESQSGKYWFSSNHSIIRDSKGVVVGIQVVAIDITQRKNFEEQLIKSAGELQDLTRHLLEVREEERTSIARDLHDDLGQKLTALNMDLTWLKTRIGVQSRPVESKFQQMTSLLNETIGSIQKISCGLRPSILDDLGLIAAIEWQLIDFNKNSGLSCSFSCSPNDVSVNSIISLAVFRIIQEALTNIARHSGATKVKIKISLTQGILEVLIRDNGSGIDPKKIESSKSFGLIGMRERVRFVSGEISITGSKGTSVIVRIPVGELPPSRPSPRGEGGD